MAGMPLLTAQSSLYDSGNFYNISLSPPSACDVWYSNCTVIAQQAYEQGLHICSQLPRTGQPQCTSFYDRQLQIALAGCDQYVCQPGQECQTDVQNPSNPPKCCPTGAYDCGGTCYVDCPPIKQIDPATCGCKCIPVACTPPHVQNPDTCDCQCPTCPPGFLQNAVTCACYCVAGFTDCFGRCVRLDSDRFNCGACGNRCGTWEQCCNGIIVPVDQDPNCGTCHHDCSTSGPGWACCSPPLHKPNDIHGVQSVRCAHLPTDPQACGSCNHPCPSGFICTAGQCVCPSNTTACGSSSCCSSQQTCCQLPSPHCADLRSSVTDCGTCGHPCPAGQKCCNGACKDTQNDSANCGGCGGNPRPCNTAAGEKCCHGICLNVHGSDAANCGDCGVPCHPDFPHCCSGHCKEFNTDPDNCGGCGGNPRPCNTAGGEVCRLGQCVCPFGEEKCDLGCMPTGNVCCPPNSTHSDSYNCPRGQRCCATGNGCCLACPSPTTLCGNDCCNLQAGYTCRHGFSSDWCECPSGAECGGSCCPRGSSGCAVDDPSFCCWFADNQFHAQSFKRPIFDWDSGYPIPGAFACCDNVNTSVCWFKGQWTTDMQHRLCECGDLQGR